MKLEFITQDDSRYILPFFDEFVRYYQSEFQIGMISLCPTMGQRPRWQLAKELLWLYGTRGFAQLGTAALLNRLLGSLPTAKEAREFHTIAQLCRACDIPCQRLADPNGAAFTGALQQRASEILVSVACPYILTGPLLRLPQLGCITCRLFLGL